nr:PREDICTED: uncharacterized protein LOC109035097 [Bemisia tabaci]
MATYTKGRNFSLPNVKKDHVGRRAPGSVCSTCGDDENSRIQESGRQSVTSQAAVSQETVSQETVSQETVSQETASQQGGSQEMVPPGHMTMETGSLEAGSLEAGSLEAESLEAGSPEAESEAASASPPPPVIGFDWRNVHPYPPCMAQTLEINPKFDLLIPEIIDCQTEASGCDGGTPQKALDYLMHTGVTLAENYPYVGRWSTGCQPDHPKAIKVAVWGQLRNDRAITQVLNGRSPIPSGYFMHPDIQLFTGGVFDPPDCRMIDPNKFNHASTIVAHDAGVPLISSKKD